MKTYNRKETSKFLTILAMLLGIVAVPAYGAQKMIDLGDEQIEDIVKRSYQYVAMYNVNNKGAMQYGRLEHR